MSTISNTSKSGGPTSSGSKRIMGANPTYKAHIQRDAKTNVGTDRDTKQVAKKVTRTTAQPKNPVALTVEKARPAGFGDGHYVPAK